jgi:phosphate acetyltransferase
MADSPEVGGRERYRRLIDAAQNEASIKVAVAHPCDDVSLGGAVEAAKLRLIKPILVGPVERVRGVAEENDLDIGAAELVDAEHSEASAAKAVELVRAGKAEALMKGSLHTDELMSAVVSRESGIRTARRMSHCFIMDVPGHAEPLIVTDAAVNIAPDLDAKVDIIQNAIDLAHAMGAPEVRVAILAAMETVTSKAPSTIEAAALSKMADRGQITGAFVDGPFALDNAISPEAAAIKKIVSPVAGRASPRSRGRQHAGQEPVVSRRRRRGGDCARRPRADHPDQQGRFIAEPTRVMRSRSHGRRRETQGGGSDHSLRESR